MQLRLRRSREEFGKATETLDHDLIIDIRKMPYISSLGIAMLISSEQALKRRGRKTVIVGPQPEVATLLKQLRIKEIMPVFETRESAFEFLTKK